ncbi:MAG: LysM repeat protein [Patiriisocius sp.]|jgi:LysM repeat protein
MLPINMRIKIRGIFLPYFLLCGLLFLTSSLTAQEKKVVGGRTYYVHIVEKGHTLYGVSKQYAVDLNVLYENNPSAADGLTIGETVLIPFSEVKAKDLKSAPVHKGEGLAHKVRKKETLYSISKLYNVDINELIARNPGAESGIVKGDIIFIPVDMVDGQNEVVLEPAKELTNNQHLVITQETIYGISKQHGISPDELRKANEGLDEGLKVGSIIRIPKNSVVEEIDNTSIEITGEAVEQVNIGLLLPFSFSLIDTTSVPSAGGNSYKMTDIAMEFYRGVQLAVENQEEMDVNLFVYDITKEESGIKKFLLKKEIDKLDVIIGPLHGSSFARVSKALKSKGIHIVSPLTKSVGVIQNNPNCSKVQSSNESHAAHLAKVTHARSHQSQIIVIDSQLPKDEKLLKAFLKSYRTLNNGVSPTVVELSKYDQQALVDQLQMEIDNLVVVPSADKPFVSDFFTRLSDEVIEDFKVELYGIEPWLKFDNISADQKNKWNLRISTSKYFNYESEETTEFLKNFYSNYNTIPVSDGYGILAYDITQFYLNGIYNFGKVFLKHLDQLPTDGLLTGFDFNRMSNGGWENNYKFILRYDSYDLIRE